MFEEIQNTIIEYFSNSETWLNIMFVMLQIILIVIASQMAQKVIKKTAQHMSMQRRKKSLKLDSRRRKTISRLISNVVTYTINFITVLLILDLLGFELLPLIAGAGIVGLAIGFGAQHLVKDVITGFFIIFEDQFAVGDIIQSGAVKGTVEEIGIRTTKIKTWDGELHIIPNGSIERVTNFSIYNSVLDLDITISSGNDLDMAIKIITESVQEVYVANDNMLKEPNILGVQAINGSHVVIRITAECIPNTHDDAARKLRAHIKQALDSNNISY